MQSNNNSDERMDEVAAPLGQRSSGSTHVVADSTPKGEPSNNDSSSGYTDLKKKKKMSPLAILHREWKASLRILDRHSGTPEEDLTATERESLLWAREIQKRTPPPPAAKPAQPARQAPTGPARTAPKRQRSEDEEQRQAKKPNQGPSPKAQPKPLSEVMKDHLVRAIVDKSHPEGNITADQWRLTEGALQDKFMERLQELTPGAPPQFNDAGWYQGRIKLLACSDVKSADFLEKAISKVGELWPGAKLEAVSKEAIPQRPRSRAWLPEKPADPEQMLSLIKACNPDLPTQDWRIARMGEPKKGRREAILILNNKSVPILQSKKGLIHVGFVSVTLQVYQGDCKEVKRQETAEGLETTTDMLSRLAAADLTADEEEEDGEETKAKC